MTKMTTFKTKILFLDEHDYKEKEREICKKYFPFESSRMPLKDSMVIVRSSDITINYDELWRDLEYNGSTLINSPGMTRLMSSETGRLQYENFGGSTYMITDRTSALVYRGTILVQTFGDHPDGMFSETIDRLCDKINFYVVNMVKATRTNWPGEKDKWYVSSITDGQFAFVPEGKLAEMYRNMARFIGDSFIEV